MNKPELTLENYIVQLIKKREEDLQKLIQQKADYTDWDYMVLFNRYTGAINDLYMSLTAYSNPLSQIAKTQ